MALTPVVLTRDTAVTNHTYRTGEPHAYQSVLQAGTPVLIDDRGPPRAQCSCGNPLLPPEKAEPDTFEGDAWNGFDEHDVIEVAPAAQVTPTIETVDLDGSDPVILPVGGDVSLIGLLVADLSGVHVLDETTKTMTTVLDQPVSAVYDDGAGGLVYTLQRTKPVDEPVSLTAEAPSSNDEATIWHLPGGQADPVPLVASTDYSTTWNVALGTGSLGGRRLAVFAAMRRDPTDEFTVADEAIGDLFTFDLESGETQQLEPKAFGWEVGSGPFSFGGDRVAYDQGYSEPWWVLRGADRRRQRNVCRPTSVENAEQQTDQGYSAEEYEFLTDNCP